MKHFAASKKNHAIGKYLSIWGKGSWYLSEKLAIKPYLTNVTIILMIFTCLGKILTNSTTKILICLSQNSVIIVFLVYLLVFVFFFFSCVLSEEEKVAPHSYQLGAILALMTERRSPEERKQFHTFIWDCDTVRQTWDHSVNTSKHRQKQNRCANHNQPDTSDCGFSANYSMRITLLPPSR